MLRRRTGQTRDIGLFGVTHAAPSIRCPAQALAAEQSIRTHIRCAAKLRVMEGLEGKRDKGSRSVVDSARYSAKVQVQVRFLAGVRRKTMKNLTLVEVLVCLAILGFLGWFVFGVFMR